MPSQTIGVVMVLSPEEVEESIRNLIESTLLWPDSALDPGRLAARRSLQEKMARASALLALPPQSG